MKYKICLLIFLSVLVTGCQNSTSQLLAADESAVKLRSMQTRAFDTSEREQTLRAVIATMQDLGFVIDKADQVLGSVSGTKLDGYALRLTVSVRKKGKARIYVRANAQYNITAVEDPEPYRAFFASLEKAMFLTAHDID